MQVPSTIHGKQQHLQKRFAQFSALLLSVISEMDDVFELKLNNLRLEAGEDGWIWIEVGLGVEGEIDLSF